MCDVISQLACRYMLANNVSDRWAGNVFYGEDHERLGLALKFLDLEGDWVNSKNIMRCAQWNRFLRIFINTLAETMYDNVAMANARTMELRGFSHKKMTLILTITLGLVFD
jgi:hypothetical protein